MGDVMTWASYQIRKIAGCACAGNAGNVFPRRRFQMKPLVSDPGMLHGTCVTHVPWCMSGSLTCGDGENVPGIPGACAPAISRIWQEVHENACPITGHFVKGIHLWSLSNWQLVSIDKSNVWLQTSITDPARTRFAKPQWVNAFKIRCTHTGTPWCIINAANCKARLVQSSGNVNSTNTLHHFYFQYVPCLLHTRQSSLYDYSILQTTFSNVFSWMKMWEFRLLSHRSLFQRIQFTIFHHWLR